MDTAQRAHTIHAVNFRDIKIRNNLVMIPITTSIKQRKPGNNKFIINLKPFENKFICIVEFLKVYIERTSTLRKEET